MATITTADFKNGIGINFKGKICTLVEFQHVKPGKGGVRLDDYGVVTEAGFEPFTQSPHDLLVIDC